MYLSGMETNNKKGATPEAGEAPKKKQAVSASYTVRAFGQNLQKLVELELIDHEKYGEVVKELSKHVVENYTKKLMKIEL